jgi:adenylate kinase
MRAIVTGQIGVDKKPYLNAVVDAAERAHRNVELFNVGDLMYREAPDVRPGRILDLPWSRLANLRRAVLKDVIAATSPPAAHPNVIVNTHATFRWRHGLFSAFDFDQLQMLRPEMFICLVDNIEVVHHRLHREHDIDATLKDCMVWREEEILATELMAQALGCGQNFYILSRGRQPSFVLDDEARERMTYPHVKLKAPCFNAFEGLNARTEPKRERNAPNAPAPQHKLQALSVGNKRHRECQRPETLAQQPLGSSCSRKLAT